MWRRLWAGCEGKVSCRRTWRLLPAHTQQQQQQQALYEQQRQRALGRAAAVLTEDQIFVYRVGGKPTLSPPTRRTPAASATSCWKSARHGCRATAPRWCVLRVCSSWCPAVGGGDPAHVSCVVCVVVAVVWHLCVLLHLHVCYCMHTRRKRECTRSHAHTPLTPAQEDSHTVELALDSESALLGVYDGHGGAECANFCQQHAVRGKNRGRNQASALPVACCCGSCADCMW